MPQQPTKAGGVEREEVAKLPSGEKLRHTALRKKPGKKTVIFFRKEAVMKDWPEQPYLEPKTEGRTYLEWLYQPRRSAEADLARLRQLWKDEPRVRAQLVQLAKAFRFHGAAALRLAPLPGCRAALHAAVQGIISKGLA